MTKESFIITKALRKSTGNDSWKLKIESLAQTEVVQGGKLPLQGPEKWPAPEEGMYHEFYY